MKHWNFKRKKNNNKSKHVINQSEIVNKVIEVTLYISLYIHMYMHVYLDVFQTSKGGGNCGKIENKG